MICDCCWLGPFPLTDLATLIDKNGHRWRICPECVTFMWSRRPPAIPESVDTDD